MNRRIKGIEMLLGWGLQQVTFSISSMMITLKLVNCGVIGSDLTIFLTLLAAFLFCQSFLFPLVQHLLEDEFLVELQLSSHARRHVCQVNHKSHQVSRVALHKVVLVLADGELVAVRVRARNVEEAVRIGRVRQDVVVMHVTKAVLAVGGRSDHQRLEVPQADPRHADPLLRHNFLTEPEFSVARLEGGVKGREALDHGLG